MCHHRLKTGQKHLFEQRHADFGRRLLIWCPNLGPSPLNWGLTELGAQTGLGKAMRVIVVVVAVVVVVVVVPCLLLAGFKVYLRDICWVGLNHYISVEVCAWLKAFYMLPRVDAKTLSSSTP